MELSEQFGDSNGISSRIAVSPSAARWRVAVTADGGPVIIDLDATIVIAHSFYADLEEDLRPGITR